MERAFKNKFKNLKLTNSELIAKNGLQLPMHSKLTVKDCKKIIKLINSFFVSKGFYE